MALHARCLPFREAARRSRRADANSFITKLGNYPSMPLGQAREVFKRDYADLIQKGRSIKIATDTRPGTGRRSVRGLCSEPQGQ